MKKVAVIGSTNTDMVVRAHSIPRPGETLLGQDFVVVQGGKGANQAVAAARQGVNVHFISRIGKDSLGENALASLKADGIDTQFVSRDPSAPTGVALITLSAQGENAIVVAPGANANLSVAEVEKAKLLIDSCDVVLAQLEVPLESVQAGFQMAKSAQRKTILNPC
jgi:ribokinase